MTGLGWFSIFRLGLVQTCLGAIVVITTSTLNRLMVVELALPAVLPGCLVALHYGIQITRPQWGFRSDTKGNRTLFIIGGMVVLALGGFFAALGMVVMQAAFGLGLAVSIVAYALIGLGVGASGTSLLALLATATAPHRRAAAATITWLMMILGIAATAGTLGSMLAPYSPGLLLKLVGIIAVGAVVVTCLAVYGIEGRHAVIEPEPQPVPFREALPEIWAEPEARRFTLFVLLSMTAYFLRVRAADEGAVRLTGIYLRIERDSDGTHVVWRDKATGQERRTQTQVVIGADGARSVVARDHVTGGDKIPYVIAYHEIVRAPKGIANYAPNAAMSFMMVASRPTFTAGCSRTAIPPRSGWAAAWSAWT